MPLFVDTPAVLLPHDVQLVLNVLIFLRAEQILDQFGPLFRSHPQKLGELALRKHDGFGELATVQSQQPRHLDGHFAHLGGDGLGTRRHVEERIVSFRFPAVFGVLRHFVYQRTKLRLIVTGDSHHVRLGLFAGETFTTSLRTRVFRGTIHLVVVAALLEDQIHICLLRCAIKETGTQPLLVSGTVASLGVAGDVAIQRKGDAVENRGLTGARLAVDQEHVRSRQRREIDREFALIRPYALKFQSDQLHRPFSLSACLTLASLLFPADPACSAPLERTASTAVLSTSRSSSRTSRPSE